MQTLQCWGLLPEDLLPSYSVVDARNSAVPETVSTITLSVSQPQTPFQQVAVCHSFQAPFYPLF